MENCVKELFFIFLGGLPVNQPKIKTRKGFTLAEVLIVIGIIGVVAQATLPTLVRDFQKKMYVTAFKETYCIVSEGLRQLMAIDGVSLLADTSFYQDSVAGTNDIEIAHLEKVFKKIESMSYEAQVASGVTTGTFHGDDCAKWTKSGFYMYYYLNDPNTCYGVRQNNYKLANGSILNLTLLSASSGALYAPHPNFSGPVTQVVGQVVMDVNGLKPPNTYGRDVFRFDIGQDGALNAVGSYAYAHFYAQYYGVAEDTYRTADSKCSPTTASSGAYCTAKVIESGWEMNY